MPVVFLNINRLYRADLTDTELYDITRRAWRMAARRRERVRLAFGVVQGHIKSVYQVAEADWKDCEGKFAGRCEFECVLTDEHQAYIGQSVSEFMPAGARFVVRYNFDQ